MPRSSSVALNSRIILASRDVSSSSSAAQPSVAAVPRARAATPSRRGATRMRLFIANHSCSLVSRAPRQEYRSPRRSELRPPHLGRDTRPKAQVKGGDDEQVEQRRSDETTQDDDRHRILDLVTGNLAGHRQGEQSRCGGYRGHQDRRQPLSRPAQDQPGTEGFALIALEMLTVVDQKNAVARRN